MDLERAYSETGPKIVGYLVATGTDEVTARDLLHDAVVKIAKRTEGSGCAEGCDDLPALLFTTARNLRANRVRDDARLTFVDEVRDADVSDDSGGEGLAPLLPSDAAYLRRRLMGAFAELPAALRETYVLYQIGERSVREIAKLTGAGESLVKVRLHRAKLSLRKLLDDVKGELGHVPD